jgi:Poly A polymerase head domain/Probable RNA and SrmB- binding site of polymerase A
LKGWFPGRHPATAHPAESPGVPISAPDQAAEDPPARRDKRPRRRRERGDPVSYTVQSATPDEATDDPIERDGEPQWAVPPARARVNIDEDRIDSDAARVVRRLVRGGYEAYLVGGCVRDLLLSASPKDFDVATSARPEAVRRLFRNSRIIGRRFRLVHVLFGSGKVIETATFRRNPSDEDSNSEDLLIRDDNTFGDAHEDALRRDFTINALFYDLESGEVLDWCDGMRDIGQRAVRTIGDPVIRFAEDPVRMLRAVRFSARLDVGIDPETYNAIVQCRALLAKAARPRLFDEVLKLLRAGAAHRSVWLAWETGLLDVLLPELSAFLYDSPPDRARQARRAESHRSRRGRRGAALLSVGRAHARGLRRTLRSFGRVPRVLGAHRRAPRRAAPHCGRTTTHRSDFAALGFGRKHEVQPHAVVPVGCGGARLPPRWGQTAATSDHRGGFCGRERCRSRSRHELAQPAPQEEAQPQAAHRARAGRLGRRISDGSRRAEIPPKFRE